MLWKLGVVRSNHTNTGPGTTKEVLGCAQTRRSACVFHRFLRAQRGPTKPLCMRHPWDDGGGADGVHPCAHLAFRQCLALLSFA